MNTWSEGTGPPGVFVPETVAVAQVLECLAHDAAEDGADHGARDGPLGDAGRPQVDVVGRLVDLRVAFERVVGEGAAQVIPVTGPGQSAELAEGVVAGNAVVATALHVERRQIRAPVVLLLLEQVVGQLLGHGLVDGLRHLVHETGQVLVAGAALVHVERPQQHLGQTSGADVLMRHAPTFDGRRNERVAEPEGRREERHRQRRVQLGVVFAVALHHTIGH